MKTHLRAIISSNLGTIELLNGVAPLGNSPQNVIEDRSKTIQNTIDFINWLLLKHTELTVMVDKEYEYECFLEFKKTKN